MFRKMAIASLAIFAVSCAHYGQDEGEKLANRTYAAETQLQALQKALREQQQLTERHAEQIDENSIQVQGLSKAARRNDADLGVQVEQIMQTLAQMKGLVEGLKDRTDEIEQKVNRLEEEMKISAAKNEDEKKQAIQEAKRREQVLSNPEALVGEVISLINGQKAAEARSLLREFLLRAKTNRVFKRSAGDAQFLIGETFYVEGDYKRAATEYNTVRKKYPKSKKVPDALYKMGRCFEHLGLPDDAKLFYSTLRKQHKRSSAAKKAGERLKQLRKR